MKTKKHITFKELSKYIKESIDIPLPPFEADEQTEADGDFMKAVSEFGVKTLVFSMIVHFWHINCTKSGDHFALKDLYEALEDYADSLLETVLGNTGIPVAGNISVNYGEFGDFSIEDIRNYKAEAEGLEGRCGANIGIANILGDIVETCDSAIYKLVRLD